MKKQQHIILVHGMCHGAWSWYKVATLLKSAGHRVTVPDLAASGINGRKIEDLMSFSDYSQPLMEIMVSLPAGEKVILVGHSLGGINIALAADRFPEKVAALVFVAAFMPDCTHDPCYVIDKCILGNEEVPYEWVGWMDTQFSSIEGKPFAAILFGPQFMATKMYQNCLPEDLTLATTLLRPGSLFTDATRPIHALSKDRYGSVPNFFIQFGEDFAIIKDHQHWMTQNYQVSKLFEIEGADHMGLLSTPSELCECLFEIADSVDGSFISE